AFLRPVALRRVPVDLRARDVVLLRRVVFRAVVAFLRPVLLRRVPVLFFRAVAFLRRPPVRLREVEPAAAVFRRVVRRPGRAARTFSTASSSTCSCTGSTDSGSRCSLGSSGVLLNG